MRTLKIVGIGCMVVLAILAYVFLFNDPSGEAPVPTPPDSGKKEITISPIEAVPATHTPVQGNEDVAVVSSPPPMKAEPAAQTMKEAIDQNRLSQAELELVNNQIYEDVARDTLPSLSIQTHNPVWALEQEAAADGAGDEDDQSGPLPAPEAGEFGMIQPPEGEIWIRIPVDYASEHRDVMAQYADLYRTETGYDGAVTVMLWVGGRPHDRQRYD